eukprot:CAMPEP_0180803756 /NCGR_PEP_ID=MMETSP1038_2-20121128/61079_1 /TAXON_ID=632150 /ORGANISM="Azadinium spinosum, Strain 3D9" /LENGTH=120 /DNA_ID=CAMNT_0022844117 /DNA_START=154 /DNA_END=516 /DNA_ORIENTATION=-
MGAKEEQNDVPLDAVTLLPETNLERIHAFDATEGYGGVRVLAVGDQVHTNRESWLIGAHDVGFDHLPHICPLTGAIPGAQDGFQLGVSFESGGFQKQCAEHLLDSGPVPAPLCIGPLMEL